MSEARRPFSRSFSSQAGGTFEAPKQPRPPSFLHYQKDSVPRDQRGETTKYREEDKTEPKEQR